MKGGARVSRNTHGLRYDVVSAMAELDEDFRRLKTLKERLALLGLALDLEAPPIYYNKALQCSFRADLAPKRLDHADFSSSSAPRSAKADYIQTASGNKVSRASVLCGSQNITLVGNSVIKPGTVLRGDLQLLKIGRHVIVGENCVLRPSHKKYKAKKGLWNSLY